MDGAGGRILPAARNNTAHRWDTILSVAPEDVEFATEILAETFAVQQFDRIGVVESGGREWDRVSAKVPGGIVDLWTWVGETNALIVLFVTSPAEHSRVLETIVPRALTTVQPL